MVTDATRARASVVASFALAASLLGSGAARADRTETVLPSPPLADIPQPTRSMTLPEAIAFAHAHQPAIHAALARIAAREAEASVPSSQWLPVVGVSAQGYAMTANNSTGTFLQTTSLDVPRIGATASPTSFSSANLAPYPTTFIGAGVFQQLFDFGRIGAQRAAADELVAVEKHSADAERLGVDFGVEEAYFAVLAARSIVVASEQAFDRARIHRDLAKRGVDSGLRSPIELTRAEADLARFDVGRVRARGGLAVSQSVLAAAIGAADPAIDVAPEPPTVADLPAIADALERARNHDPLLAEAIAQLRAAEARERAVGAELRPDLEVTGTLSGRAGGAPTTAGATPTGSGWLPEIPNWDVGVILSWPLFDGTISARRDAAKAVEQVRHDEIDVALQKEVATVRQAYIQVKVARTALVSLENGVVAARANYDQADARFRAGIGNAVELADAEALRTDAEIQLALGQFEVARARAAFGRAIAEGL